MNFQFKVLIIHSHQEENTKIKNYLETKDYQCDQIFHKKDLSLIENQYDCIIINNDFPSIQLENLLAQIKQLYNPIILVITDSNSSSYLETLLNSGADDYLTIPYDLNDLDIKIQSVYKTGVLKPREVYRFKDILLNVTKRTCICNGQPVELTKNEFLFLKLLISHPYQPFDSQYLFENIWGSSLYEDETTLPYLINSTILKLRAANPHVDYIKRFGKNSYKMAF